MTDKKWASIFFVLGGILILLNVVRFSKLFLSDDDPSDYRTLFTGAKIIQDGGHVYDTLAHFQLWEEIVLNESLNSKSSPGQINISAVTYPPHAYPLFVFNQFLNWTQARVVWWIICFTCFVLILYSFRSTLMLALGLGFKGSFFALLLGQPMLLVVALIACIVSLSSRRRYVLIAGLLPLALVKFTLVIPIVVWLGLQNKWKSLLIGGLLTMGIYGLMFYAHPTILQDYFSSATAYYEYIYSFSPSNLYPSLNSELTSLFNVMMPLSMDLIKCFNSLGQLFGFGFLALLYYRRLIDKNWLLYLLFLVSFLFSYHLIYDALILLIPMAKIYRANTARAWVYVIPFILVSLPWNLLSEVAPVVKFHFPIILLLALFLSSWSLLVKKIN